MSVLHVGAYSWSYSGNSNSSSNCEVTIVSDVSVHVSGSGCSNCSAISSGEIDSNGANAYGGSMSVLHVGAYSWSFSYSGNSGSLCEATIASDVSVHVSGSGCSNCSAISTSGSFADGANSYGGVLNAAFIGAYSHSFADRGFLLSFSRAVIGITEVIRLSITIQDSSIVDAVAASGEYCRTRSISPRTGLTLSFRIKLCHIRCQCECFVC
jgi:hypothetical protein